MERCDFVSIMTIIKRFIVEDQDQMDLMYLIFANFANDKENQDYDFDNGQVCRWLNGQTRVSPRISGYYLQERNRKKMAYNLYDNLFPLLSDSGMAIQRIYELIISDPTISESKKQELTEGYPCEGPEEGAELLAEVLFFGISREFVKRDVRRKGIAASGMMSPLAIDFIYGGDVPKPCRYFCGRDEEISELHRVLVNNSKVFLRGIAGIGKSELAKAYAKQYKKDYTNILYISYSGNLKKDIMELDFADDITTDSQEERFRKHNRFLRLLYDDSLIIVDNFNMTAEQDSFLHVMLKYRCRILFTSRNTWDDYTEYVLNEISDMDLLITLFGSFFDGTVKHRDIILKIIETVHRHTLAVELAARLLNCGMLKPNALLKKLQEEKVKLDVSDQIRITKDGTAQKETYYGHIHTLFALYKLSEKIQKVLCNLTMMPFSGISAKRFAKWLRLSNMNPINDLIEMGLVTRLAGNMIALQPMIQETALADLVPSVQRCRTLLSSIQEVCLMHGKNEPWHRGLFQTVENVIRFVDKDDMPFYIRFLEDAFPYMEVYQYEEGMATILEELSIRVEQMVEIQPREQALLLDFRAAMEKNTERAIKLEKNAISALGEVTEDIAHLASNLHANLGYLYLKVNKLRLAKQHMEHGMVLLKEYGLTYTHDTIQQVCNYAVLLTDIGEADEAMSALRKLLDIVRTYNTDHCSDYAIVLETMGGIHLAKTEVREATDCFKQAVAVYELVWEEEPELIEAKRQELRALYPATGIAYGKQLVGLMKKRQA